MITGQVNPQLEACISVLIRDSSGSLITQEAAIDTGFSGYLTLPRHLIEMLGLGFLTSRVYTLGDNSEVNFDVYLCVASLDGEERNCKVLASEAFPLVGMAFLKGHRLAIDVIDGGEVCVELRK